VRQSRHLHHSTALHNNNKCTPLFINIFSRHKLFRFLQHRQYIRVLSLLSCEPTRPTSFSLSLAAASCFSGCSALHYFFPLAPSLVRIYVYIQSTENKRFFNFVCLPCTSALRCVLFSNRCATRSQMKWSSCALKPFLLCLNVFDLSLVSCECDSRHLNPWPVDYNSLPIHSKKMLKHIGF
jgi:hypothetical protein